MFITWELIKCIFNISLDADKIHQGNKVHQLPLFRYFKYSCVLNDGV